MLACPLELCSLKLAALSESGLSRQKRLLSAALDGKNDQEAMSKQAQGRQAIEELKKRPYTYAQMQRMGLGTCVWKRVAECLREDEKLIKGKHASGCVTWAVRTVRPTKWTA